MDIGATAAKAGAVLLVLHQIVDLRAKTHKQQDGLQVVAGTVAAATGDVSAAMSEIARLKRRVALLEKPAALGVGRNRGPEGSATYDVPAPRSGVLETILAAPARAVAGAWKWVFG